MYTNVLDIVLHLGERILLLILRLKKNRGQFNSRKNKSKYPNLISYQYERLVQ